MADDQGDRPNPITDDELDADDRPEQDGDHPGGWAGVSDALSVTGDVSTRPDSGESSLDSETPGSQGEIPAGSEGDFGRHD
jgi:hypothetical protein